MASFLPLLVADGRPVSLDTISCEQLERFIPFMLQCCPDYRPGVTPSWWPSKVPYCFPMAQPRGITTANWTMCMRSLVCQCYTFYNAEKTLQFCSRLTQLPANSTYLKQYPDGLVKIHLTGSDKVVVVFKKKNLEYDRLQVICKSPRRLAALIPYVPQEKQPHIEDIYLCNYCDEEFASCKAIQDHEIICKGKADQEIDESNVVLDQKQHLKHFGLCPSVGGKPIDLESSSGKRTTSLKFSSRNHLAIPFSSPLGRRMLGNAQRIPLHVLYEKRCNIEKYCTKSVISSSNGSRPRRYGDSSWNKNTRRHRMCAWSHIYCFNRAQRRENLRTIAEGLNYNSRKLLRSCKPCLVVIERLSLLDPAALYASAHAEISPEEFEPLEEPMEGSPTLTNECKGNPASDSAHDDVLTENSEFQEQLTKSKTDPKLTNDREEQSHPEQADVLTSDKEEVDNSLCSNNQVPTVLCKNPVNEQRKHLPFSDSNIVIDLCSSSDDDDDYRNTVSAPKETTLSVKPEPPGTPVSKLRSLTKTDLDNKFKNSPSEHASAKGNGRMETPLYAVCAVTGPSTSSCIDNEKLVLEQAQVPITNKQGVVIGPTIIAEPIMKQSVSAHNGRPVS